MGLGECWGERGRVRDGKGGSAGVSEASQDDRGRGGKGGWIAENTQIRWKVCRKQTRGRGCKDNTRRKERGEDGRRREQ